MSDLFNRIPLGPFDSRLWWLLIGLCALLLFTVQAVETVVEGAWPHQRRPARSLPQARAVQASWAFVAALVLPGAVLAIGNVVALLWLDVPSTDAQITGSILLTIGWVLFLVFGLDFFRLGGLMTNLGVIGPITLLLILGAADILLLIGLLDILPAWSDVGDAIERGARDLAGSLPFTE